MDVGITGASGLVGTILQDTLHRQGHRPIPLTRGKGRRSWYPMDPEALEGLDAVVHLAGESIADGRWNAPKKRRIRDSRVKPTRVLAESIAAQDDPPIFLCASAVGWYGDRGEERLTPEAPKGEGFLADVVADWEAACDPARHATRVVNLRSGIILTPRGGALKAMLPAFRAGVGGPLAGGRQWMPWIGVHDAATVITRLLSSDHEGPVNVVAGAIRQRDFAASLGKVLGRPAFMPMPRLAVSTVFGQKGTELLLASQRVEPSFAWADDDLEAVLRREMAIA